MPQKNSIKIYYEDGFYHVYNRGVEKRDIFLEEQDYIVLLHLFKAALLPKEVHEGERAGVSLDLTGLHPNQGATLQKPRQYVLRPRQNFCGSIELICYCLMPNHYHLLVKQLAQHSLTQFIRSVFTTYAMYFNKKYERVGSLFQGIFKATDIDKEGYFLWVSRYIHRNPADFGNYPYSSYADFLGRRQTKWIKSGAILDCYGNTKETAIKNYQEFVESDKEEPGEIEAYHLE